MTDPPATVATRLRGLPAVDRLLAHADDLVAVHGRTRVLAALRVRLDLAREDIRSGGATPDVDTLLDAARHDLTARPPTGPRRVINATGVIVHTNLGRAPLSSRARAAVEQAAGACDLEYDLGAGARGSRGAHVDGLLTQLTGAEAATTTNNAAAALVLVLAALAPGRGVAVSRGELVEIGGSFRLPDIMAASGARLVEVGTTNRTRADDYEAGDDVGMLLRMHPSNYRIVGFTATPTIEELADVARRRNVPLVHDVGSGLVADTTAGWATGETSIRGSLAAGADVVIASGDKLLGGPQAGLVVGRGALVTACRRHPLARALRLDKLRLAALAATLDAHLADPADPDVPVHRMLTAGAASLRPRAERVAAALPGAEVSDGASLVGGGAAPDAHVAGPVVSVAVDDPDDAAARLRVRDLPVIVRIADGRLVIDPRTVDPADDDDLRAALRAVLGSG